MVVARDMIEQLGLSIYAEGLHRVESGRAIAWIKCDLPTRKKPFGFTLQNTYEDPCLLDIHAWKMWTM